MQVTISFSQMNERFLGSSGQPIEDLLCYVDKDAMELTELTLKWRHLCPSAPDTLWVYPFYERDPFILENMPHVYFVGNQERFETKQMKSNVYLILLTSKMQMNRMVL